MHAPTQIPRGPLYPELLPADSLATGRYQFTFARTAAQLQAALRLRFEVFHDELGEGLAENQRAGLDVDAFDRQFHHLLAVHCETGEVVGCYRLQTAAQAAGGGFGWYAATEFDLRGLGVQFLDEAIEIGRACLAPAHRCAEALLQLWNGLAAYARHNHKRHLFGCSSLHSSDAAAAHAAIDALQRQGAFDATRRVQPLPHCRLGNGSGQRNSAAAPAAVPPLLAAYLRLGAKVLGEPAVDRAFGTIDFLTAIDLETMARRTARFVRPRLAS